MNLIKIELVFHLLENANIPNLLCTCTVGIENTLLKFLICSITLKTAKLEILNLLYICTV